VCLLHRRCKNSGVGRHQLGTSVIHPDLPRTRMHQRAPRRFGRVNELIVDSLCYLLWIQIDYKPKLPPPPQKCAKPKRRNGDESDQVCHLFYETNLGT